MRTTFKLWLLIIAFGFSAVASGGTCDSSKNASLISVVQGLETSGIDFALREGGSISGRVYEADGTTPIYDVELMIYDLGWNFIRFVWTNQEGYYLAEGLPEGQCYVAAGTASGPYECRYYQNSETKEDTSPVDIVEGLVTWGIDFRLALLQGRGSISGHVYEADTTAPIGWAAVDVYNLGKQWIRMGSTDGEGYYQIGGLLPGQYYIEVWTFSDEYVPQYYERVDSLDKATPVEVVLETDTPGIDFYLRRPSPQGTGSISGHVYSIDGGTPIEGVGVEAQSAEGLRWVEVTTDSNGYYEISGLLPGEYYVSAGGNSDYVSLYYDDSPTQQGATLVSVVAGGQTPGIDFSLVLGGSISGQVCEVKWASPVSWVWVSVYDTEWHAVRGTDTDDDGYYKIGGLETGQYYVKVSPFDYVPGYYCKGFSIDPPRVSQEGIVLRWESEDGRQYKILTTSDLLAWDELPLTVSATAGQTYCEWTDSSGWSFPRRFYKIRQLEE